MENELYKQLGIAGLIIVASVWLIREITKQLLSKDLEKFKSDLEKESLVFRIRFEKLHSERAEVVKEVYKRIVRAYKSMRSFISPLQFPNELSEEEKGKMAAKEANTMMDYYDENRIFFTEDLALQIDELLQHFREAWTQFGYARHLKASSEPNTKEWNEAWKKIDEEVPKVKKVIETRFREVIGIEEYGKNK